MLGCGYSRRKCLSLKGLPWSAIFAATSAILLFLMIIYMVFVFIATANAQESETNFDTTNRWGIDSATYWTLRAASDDPSDDDKLLGDSDTSFMNVIGDTGLTAIIDKSEKGE